MLNRTIPICIEPGGVPEIIYISQFDVGLQTFVFVPYTNNGTLTIPSGASATLEGTKPDGYAFVHNCTYNTSNGQITYTVQDQLAAVAGRVWSKLVIRDTSGNILGFRAIVWIVDYAGVKDGAVVSDSDLSALEEFVKEFGSINAYKAALDGAMAAVGGPLTASTVAQMTDKTKVYVYTGSQSGYTSGHWYYWNGSAWTDGGVYQATAVETDKNLTVADMAADGKATGDAITELKNDLDDVESKFNRVPELFNSNNEADLNFADDNGNVILKLANGEIITKNFNSADSLTEDELSKISLYQNPLMVSGGDDADLYVSDDNGNVLAKFKDGSFQVKNFKGFDFVTFQSETKTYTGTELMFTINRRFSKGDRIVLHMERGEKPWEYGAYVTYRADQTIIVDNWRGDSTWLEYTLTEDIDEISAVYPSDSNFVPRSTNITFEVSLIGDIPIRPTVVTVKQDGTGDYTTLRGALDFIGIKANDVLNPYRIEIYPGVYDVLADYTDDEISSAKYTQTDFVGPKLLNGMYLVGMGAFPEEVVLTASLDPEKWSNTVRNAISTLNCQGTCGFENVTVEAHNIRYCVHDDYHTTLKKKIKRVVKNCIFRGYNISYTPGHAYGAATTSSGCDFEFINCDFGEIASIHTMPTLQHRSNIHLINCTGAGFIIGDYETTSVEETGYNVCRFDGCGFPWIGNNLINGAVSHALICGSGNRSPMYQLPSLTPYMTDDITIVPNASLQFTGGVGTVVERFSNTAHGPRFRLAASAKTAEGVVVYQDDNNTYIQTRGYVKSDRTNLTQFVLGDYVGLLNDVMTIVTDTVDAFAQIRYIDSDGYGYMMLKGV